MNALDVLRAGEAGRENSQSMFDQFARQRAGNALAQGDYQGGANALLRSGQIGAGLGVQRAGEQQDDGDVQEAAEKLEFLSKASRMLRQLPMEARKGALGQLRQTFIAMGLPDEVVAQMEAADLSDQTLDLFGGSVEQAKAQIRQSGRYTYALDPASGKELWRHEAPADSARNDLPQGYEMGPEGRPRIADWYVQGERAKAGAKRAPPRGRSGGGRSSGGGYPGLPPGYRPK
jgi:hypothetical protein